MDRRRILLLIAAVVAALGTLLVFLYVRTADARAQDSVDAVQVLTAASPSPPARATTTPWPPARSPPKGVARSQLLANVQTSPDALKGTVALQNILPGEQIVADKFGANVAEVVSPLGIPEGKMAISVNLTDPDRGGRLRQPRVGGRHLRHPSGAATAACRTDQAAPAIASPCSASAARRRSRRPPPPRTAPRWPSSCRAPC